MRKKVKSIVSFFLIPLTRWYLRKERPYIWNAIRVRVFPGVFHPGFFHSTKFILRHLSQQDLSTKTLLEMGSGSGLISVLAAKKGASVTAVDVSRKAIENTSANALLNKVGITTLYSDLFTNVPPQQFDWVVINPPYYERTPQNEEELAWNAGANFEYFEKLFISLADYTSSSSQIIMVLTKGTDIHKIQSIAARNEYYFDLIAENKVLLDEADYLFRVVRKTDGLL